MAEQKQEFKYLAIRNWERFQSTTDKHGKSLEGKSRPYIRDYCDKETDSQYASLRIFGRYLFDACRRLRGKHGRNLLNDPMWIVRQLDVHSSERGRAVVAIGALIGRGLLIPTNEQFSVPQQPYCISTVINTGRSTATEQFGNGSPAQVVSVDERETNLGETPNPRTDKHRDELYAWATTRSNFWPDVFAKTSDPYACFLKNFSKISVQYDNYMAKAKAKGNGKAKRKEVAADDLPAILPEDMIKDDGAGCYIGFNRNNAIVVWDSRQEAEQDLPRLLLKENFRTVLEGLAEELGKQVLLPELKSNSFIIDDDDPDDKSLRDATMEAFLEGEVDIPGVDTMDPTISKSFVIEDDEEG